MSRWRLYNNKIVSLPWVCGQFEVECGQVSDKLQSDKGAQEPCFYTGVQPECNQLETTSVKSSSARDASQTRCTHQQRLTQTDCKTLPVCLRASQPLSRQPVQSLCDQNCNSLLNTKTSQCSHRATISFARLQGGCRPVWLSHNTKRLGVWFMWYQAA